MQFAAFAVVLWTLPYKAFELDRFFVPKELVLHASAGLCTLLLLARRGPLALNRLDLLLGTAFGVSAISALFATNHWLAARALGVTLSGLLVFIGARLLSERGYARRLLTGVSAAVVIGALTGLLQAYGLEGAWMSLSRAPGGTFGNRNFLAHLSAIGLPAMVWLALMARTRRRSTIGLIGILLTIVALVLSRSRAAWLALMVAGALTFVLSITIARGVWRDRRLVTRLLALVLVGVVGTGAALLVPNTLDWNSDSPYLDSMRGVVNYRDGSGHGRLVQYRNSLRLALRRPLLGVGPGNWAVRYPEVAANDDPSMSSRDGMTSNPWPSSDWVAWISERGVLALAPLLLALAGASLAAAGLAARATDTDERVRAMALFATVAATVVVAAFDAVTLLAVPAFFAWVLIGALLPPMREKRRLQGGRRAMWMAGAVLLAFAAFAYSAAQARAMAVYSSSTRTAALREAVRLDPGSYRIRLRLAERRAQAGDCDEVREHAGAARRLFPSAGAPRRLLRSCGVRIPR
jgi:O-antigen ligase